MVRSAKWMSSIAMGLVLAWEALPAEAQQSAFHGKPTPARLRQAAEDSFDDSDSESCDDDDKEISEADNTEREVTPPAPPRERRRNGGVPKASNAPRVPKYPSPDQTEKEVIKERYPDGSVRVEREAAQDEESNYHNHGSWKTWDQRGNLIAQGEFDHGSRTGTWVRWYRNPSEAPLLTRAPFSKFNQPFISQATFSNGQLDGAWTIYDGKKNKISQCEFSHGKRHGTFNLWHPNGHKMREAQYRDGELHGQLLEWNSDGTLIAKETYVSGSRQAPKIIAKYSDGSKKSEGMYLFSKEVEQTPDDWWYCKMQTTTKQGKDEKHGTWTTWYSNGQPQLEGSYEHDLQSGVFTWWHANGQKALEGRFEAGKQNGPWTWWYPTGQKSIRGEYAHGNPTGRWTWWKENGKVGQSADLSQSEGVVIDTPDAPDVDGVPQAIQPRPRQLSR